MILQQKYLKPMQIVFICLILFMGPARASEEAGLANGSVHDGKQQPFRMVSLSSMFTDINEMDARASMKAWLMNVAEKQGILMDIDPTIYQSVGDIRAVDKTKQVDAILLTLPEYSVLQQTIPFSHVTASVLNGKITEEYVLLVRRDKGWDKARSLRGKQLNVLVNPRMSLALVWLDTLLLEQGLDATARWFGSVNRITSPALAVLQVFFGKKDACVTTRESYALLGELNPQVLEQLMILAVSDPVIPSVCAFRKEPVSPFRSRILDQMERLGDSPAGRQVLTLVRADHIETHPVSILNPSLELLARHRDLCLEIPFCMGIKTVEIKPKKPEGDQ